MKHILVAYDGSTAAAKAFSLALELAEKFRAELCVLAVAPASATGAEAQAVVEYSRQHCRQILRPLQAIANSARQLAIHFEVAVGHPAEQIVRHADDWKADLVVVGQRGCNFFARWLTGSVTKHVVNHAPCAVLVAR